jgi:hypothetical protein
MKLSAVLCRRLHWLNLPGALLIALLQRTPVVRVAATAGDYVLSSTAGNVLKAAASTLGALGAMHSMAGATTLSASTPSPASGTVGVVFNTVVFSVKGAQSAAGSWTVNGGVPPGLSLKAYGTTTAGVTSGLINNASTLQLDGTPTYAGQFLVSLTAWESAGGKGTSTSFTYVINIAAAPNSAPTISTQPTSKTVPVGGTAQFIAAASGSPTPTLQWFKGSSPISGATTTILTISGATSADAATYSLVAINSIGSATSNAVTLTVTGGATAPTITTQPSASAVSVGSAASFMVVASGTSPFTYDWKKDGTSISGATNATYSIASAATRDAGSYTVVVSNSAGSVSSTAASLTVTATSTTAPRLSNLSVRTALTANQIVIVGFTMSGGSKSVLLRAAGPTLASFGVPDVMANPMLDLYNGSTKINSNDNWSGSAALSASFQSVGAFSYAASTSLDAALVTTIEGGRTLQVSGPTAGTVLVEGYDAGTGDTPRFTNLSARNKVGIGANILIAGFTLAGDGARNLLIRAVGPKLTDFGVSGVLTDPKLEIYSGSTKIAENDNWSDTLAITAASVGAFALNLGSKDAAITVSLPAGGYTVQVSGADGGVGEAIVEIYELP